MKLELNVEAMKLWRDALRSKKYIQARGKLMRVDGSMCCLGVAADIFKDEFNLKWVEVDSKLSHIFDFITLRNKVTESSFYNDLPKDLLDFLGISRDDEMAFIQANDIALESFDQIADRIDIMIKDYEAKRAA